MPSLRRGKDRRIYQWQGRNACRCTPSLESGGCRHQRLVAHFGEAIEACGEACDHCTGTDPLRSAPVVPRSRGTRGTRASRAEPGAPRAVALSADAALFERLKLLRRRLADERGVPAYLVFSDATLLEMAAAVPKTEAELLGVSGVGPMKLERYGEAFLSVLREG